MFERILRPLRRRIQLLVQRAVINAVDSSGALQLVQLQMGKNEVLHNVDHVEPYGYTSRAHKGAEAVVVSLGGSRSHVLAIVVGNRVYRLTGLEEGEVAIHDDLGQQIILKRDLIEVNAPQGYQFNGNGVLNGTLEVIGAVEMRSTLQVDQTVHADQTITSDVDCISNNISGKNHRHGGVTAGGAITAVPNP